MKGGPEDEQKVRGGPLLCKGSFVLTRLLLAGCTYAGKSYNHVNMPTSCGFHWKSVPACQRPVSCSHVLRIYKYIRQDLVDRILPVLDEIYLSHLDLQFIPMRLS